MRAQWNIQLSQTTTTPAYGIGIMTIMIAVAASLVFYQVFYLPESLLKPSVDDHILHPSEPRTINMILGSSDAEQQDNFVPKRVDIQLGIDNHVTWDNLDDIAHTVTPDHRYADSYSGDFGSEGVVMPGEKYEFLFTESAEISYFCIPHPWMTGELIVTKQRF